MSLRDDLLSESVALLKGSLNHVDGEVSLRAFDPSLDKFMNDEESIKGEDLVKETTLTLGQTQLPEPIDLPEAL